MPGSTVRHARLSAAADVRIVPDAEFAELIPDLATLLIDVVRGGGTVGFLAPLAPELARAYWLSLTADIRAGSRLLIGAFSGGRIVGAGQLVLSTFPNARHRAEIQKLFVAESMQGQGIAHSLMEALHAAARQHGRALVMLNARRGSIAERFYRKLGYREVGVVPGYTVGEDGRPADTVFMYRQLES